MSRIRCLFAGIILLFIVGVGIAWILSTMGPISSAWAPVLAATFAILGVVVAYIQLVQPFLSSKAKTPKSVRAAQKLFSALKQRRDQDGRSFKLDILPAIIPLTVCDYEDPPNSAGRSIIDMYREHPNLLILGKPGSGKTTLLQQLTLELMDKELRERENDEKARWLPTFLSLCDWAKKRKPFKEWLTQQLLDSLSIHRLDKSLIHYWVSRGNFILLLDGLDEMNVEDSEKCIDAINTFSKETDSPFVISCQLDRYENLERNGHILNVGQKTVVVQNPKPSQAQNYLNQVGAERLSRFYQEKQSQHSKEFAARPLILRTLAETYSDASLNWELPVDVSEEELMTEEELMKRYVNHAIDTKSNPHGVKNMSLRLTRLAHSMCDRPFFYFRPDYLPHKTAKCLYVVSTWLIILLLGGAACLIVALGKFPLWQLLPLFALIVGLYGVFQLLPLFALIAGLYGFLFKSLVTGLCMILLYVLTLTFPFFPLASSKGKTWLRRLGEVLFTEMVILSPVILVTALVFIRAQAIGIPIWLGILGVWLIGGLLWYAFYRLGILQRLLKSGNKSSVLYTWLTVVYLMIVRLVEPLSPEKLSPRTPTPPGLIKGMSIGIACGLIILLSGYFIWQTNLILAAVLIGISVWLDMGLGASIRGSILRFWFRWFKILPWNSGFLDDAVTMRLLEEKGGGYKFFFGTSMQKYFRGQSSD